MHAARERVKAFVAVAASMRVAAHAILRDGQNFRDLGANDFTRRDQARVVHRLTQKLQSLGYQVDLCPARGLPRRRPLDAVEDFGWTLQKVA